MRTAARQAAGTPRTGSRTEGSSRRSPPPWAARTVVHVGAGAGSYESTTLEVTAVEPSASMRAQRPAHLPAAIDAVAENLPFGDGTFDAAMTTLSVHQWGDVKAGLRECLEGEPHRPARHPHPGERALGSSRWRRCARPGSRSRRACRDGPGTRTGSVPDVPAPPRPGSTTRPELPGSRSGRRSSRRTGAVARTDRPSAPAAPWRGQPAGAFATGPGADGVPAEESFSRAHPSAALTASKTRQNW
ncbi:class I SAM-dependent methyltransferase [Streptacidiphilus monticola]|uniref:Class I SAM-dependent methyltransferase n=1 Tax=Streptacidiphilus monticola TaxID=2161674 RepID=A0ABW1G9G7_9ACTN